MQTETKKTDAEKEIERITEEIRRIRRNSRKAKLETDCKSFISIDKSLPSTLLDKQELENRLASSCSTERKSELENTAKENERRTRHNTRITVIQEQTDAFLKELAELQDILGKQEGLLSNLEY